MCVCVLNLNVTFVCTNFNARASYIIINYIILKSTLWVLRNVDVALCRTMTGASVGVGFSK